MPWQVAPWLANQVSFVVVDNIEIKNEQVFSLNDATPRSSISVVGGSNFTIQNCYIHNWSIQNPTVGSDQTPFGGVAFYNSSTGGVVQNCTIDGGTSNNSGTGIYGGATIQNNIIENVPQGIVVLDPQANVNGNQIFNLTNSIDPTVTGAAIRVNGGGSIYNNVVHDLVSSASAIYLESASLAAGNTQFVYNNLVWNAGNNPPIVIDPTNLNGSFVSDQELYNNTISGGALGCVSVNTGTFPLSTLIVENNHCISDQPASQAWCWSNSGGGTSCGAITNLTFANNVLMTTALAATQNYVIAESFQPSAPTGATVGAGLNLVNSCVNIGASLCSDRLAVSRPSGFTAWDTGAYMFQASNSTEAPALTTQPVSQMVSVGQTATFSVVATGAAQLTYQWQKNGATISGATSASYTTPATSAADDASIYAVVVSNSVGSVTSSPAILSVTSGAAQLSASTTSLNFGSIVVGASSTMVVTITNSGNAPATISGVAVPAQGFTATSVPAGLVIAPGETATLALAFTPTVVATFSGTVTVTSNATNSPISIAVSGSGALADPHSVTLTWTASTTPSVVGYYVFRGNQSGGPYFQMNMTPVAITQYNDTSAQAGQTYFYVVVAVDASGATSEASTVVSVRVQFP